MSGIESVVAASVLGAAAFAGQQAVRAWWRFRGTRVITCPESHRPAAVDVDRRRAALGAVVGPEPLRLAACSRWPEMAGCDQACLAQIAAAPDGCLARAMLAGWYAGKRCTACGTAFQTIHWHDRKPALVTPDGFIRDWSDVPPADLPDVLGSHRPVCWSCEVAARFQRDFPELVIDRRE